MILTKYSSIKRNMHAYYPKTQVTRIQIIKSPIHILAIVSVVVVTVMNAKGIVIMIMIAWTILGVFSVVA